MGATTGNTLTKGVASRVTSKRSVIFSEWTTRDITFIKSLGMNYYQTPWASGDQFHDSEVEYPDGTSVQVADGYIGFYCLQYTGFKSSYKADNRKLMTNYNEPSVNVVGEKKHSSAARNRPVDMVVCRQKDREYFKSIRWRASNPVSTNLNIFSVSPIQNRNYCLSQLAINTSLPYANPDRNLPYTLEPCNATDTKQQWNVESKKLLGLPIYYLQTKVGYWTYQQTAIQAKGVSDQKCINASAFILFRQTCILDSTSHAQTWVAFIPPATNRVVNSDENL